LIRYFYDHPTEAARIADAAEKMMTDSTTANRLKSLEDSTVRSMLTEVRSSINQLQDLKLPIGWDQLRKQVAEEKKMRTPSAPAEKESKGDKTFRDYVSDFLDFLYSTACLFWAGLKQNLMGWLITILAVSLGAPFWYDMLNKLVDLRSAGKKPAPAPAAVTDSNKNTSDNPLG
ncbi:MAG: hypothetical protein JNK18_01085, partial [Cyclobacteriaceae bacterium]|nr:hypothetical protein [Cyclobacteriaceae bacterium]